MQPDPSITQAVAALVTVGESRGARKATTTLAESFASASRAVEAELLKAVAESKLDPTAKDETKRMLTLAFDKLWSHGNQFKRQVEDNERQHQALEHGAQQHLAVLYALSQPKSLRARLKRAFGVALRELRG